MTNNAHCIWRCDNYVEVHFAFFHEISQIFHTNQFCTSCFSCFSVSTLSEYRYADVTASTVWQYSSATNVLVRFTSIDTQVNSNVN
ncbi:Uncharacterised protein [Vibrio cholerae]|nr:Uncharacterised protein [Vibrio cholerae]CSB24785.1 Uncharacterised protein [Vibrio cholerae]CSC05458.1 Uncharacterised protein [Vibrio cholerae]